MLIVLVAAIAAQGVLVRHGKLQREAGQPVPQRCHYANVRGAEERHALKEPHLALLALLELHSARPVGVDLFRQPYDFSPGAQVVVPALERGYADLDEDDFANELGTLRAKRVASEAK